MGRAPVPREPRAPKIREARAGAELVAARQIEPVGVVALEGVETRVRLEGLPPSAQRPVLDAKVSVVLILPPHETEIVEVELLALIEVVAVSNPVLATLLGGRRRSTDADVAAADQRAVIERDASKDEFLGAFGFPDRFQQLFYVGHGAFPDLVECL